MRGETVGALTRFDSEIGSPTASLLDPASRRVLSLAAGWRLHAFPSLNDTVLEPPTQVRWRRGIHEPSASGGG